MMPNETENGSPEKFSISRNQVAVLGLVLILVGAFLFGRQFGWLDGVLRAEPVTIPSGAPYAEAAVVGVYDGVVLAERVATVDAQGNALQKNLEILTNENTIFAKLTASGPVRISHTDLSEGDIIWVYQRVRTFEETVAEPVDPDLAISFEESVKNPREKIRADFVVQVVGKE